MSLLVKFWKTVELSCKEPVRFFAGLPKGELGPPVSFSLLVETLSVGSWIILFGTASYLLFTSLTASLWANAASRQALIRGVTVAWLGFSLLLIAARSIYGTLLDRGAARHGARSRRKHVLRYVLYSTGWDFMSSPAGWLAGLFIVGPSGVIAYLRGALKAPSHASTAFLGLVYQLKANDANSVLRGATGTAITQSVVLAIIVMIAVAFVGLQ